MNEYKEHNGLEQITLGKYLSSCDSFSTQKKFIKLTYKYKKMDLLLHFKILMTLVPRFFCLSNVRGGGGGRGRRGENITHPIKISASASQSKQKN